MPSTPKRNKDRSLERMLDPDFLPAIFVAALVGSFLAHFLIKHHDPLKDAIGAVCDAVFIAAFLAYSVDPVLKRGLLKEGIKSVFRYVYGYDLPPALQNFYHNTVVGTTDLRTDFTLHWKIDPCPSVQDAVETRLHATFRMVNFTNESRSYRHEVFAVSDTPRAKGCVEVLYCQDTELDVELDDYKYKLNKEELDRLKAEELNKQPHLSHPGKALRPEYRSGPPVELEPRAANDKGRFLFGVHYYAESSWPHGLDWFRFTEVTTQAEVIVTVNETLKDQYFSIIPGPPTGADGMKPAYDVAAQEWRCHWKYPRLFVPNEILFIRWQPADMRPEAAKNVPATTVPARSGLSGSTA